MQPRMERLRIVIVVLALAGVAAAAINTKVGVYFLLGLLALLVLAAVGRWLFESSDDDSAG